MSRRLPRGPPALSPWLFSVTLLGLMILTDKKVHAKKWRIFLFIRDKGFSHFKKHPALSPRGRGISGRREGLGVRVHHRALLPFGFSRGPQVRVPGHGGNAPSSTRYQGSRGFCVGAGRAAHEGGDRRALLLQHRAVWLWGLQIHSPNATLMGFAGTEYL